MVNIYSPAYLDANISGPFVRFIIAFMTLQTFFVLLHIVARIRRKSSNGPETWFILSGYLFNMAFDITGLLEVKMGGMGRHVIAVVIQSPRTVSAGLKIMVALNYTYLMAVTLPKLGVLCIYLRIFKTHHCPKIIYLLGFVLTANLLAWILVLTLMCRPFAFNWDKSVAGGQCTNQQLSYEISGFPNIITDVVILAMPLPFIWKLQASRARKIGLMVTFWTGSIGTICAVLRLYGFFHAEMFEDITYNSVKPMEYSVAEGATYLMAATFLTIGPLLRDIRQKISSFEFRSYVRMPGSARSQNKGAVAQCIVARNDHARGQNAAMLSYKLDSADRSSRSTMEETKIILTPIETYEIDWSFITAPTDEHRTEMGEV